MSAKLEDYLKAEAKAQGWKTTEMQEKLFKIIAGAVQKYNNNDVKANVTGGSSNGSHSLVAS